MRLRRAIALGAVQGPAELLPVSSSAHLALVPWLAGWEEARADPAERQGFAVALHAGAAVALALAWRRDLPSALHPRLLLAALPPAAAGALLERPIEERLSSPAAVAGGLAAGAMALLAAERRPATRSGPPGPAALLGLGAAQAAALWPGVSRTGATLAAARALGYPPGPAAALSRRLALPVLAGAAALKGIRLGRRALTPPYALGAAAAFASALLAARLAPTPLPSACAVYRLGLAAVVVGRLRENRRA